MPNIFNSGPVQHVCVSIMFNRKKQMHPSKNLTNIFVCFFLLLLFFGDNIHRTWRDSRRVKINSTKLPPWQKQASSKMCTQITQNDLAFPNSSSQQEKVWQICQSMPTQTQRHSLPIFTLTTTNSICCYKTRRYNTLQPLETLCLPLHTDSH